jgi:hypothetical protein
MTGLANLTHRPGENPRMFFSGLEELIYVLEENYASYRVKPDSPAQEAAGGYSEDSLTKANNDNMDSFANFMFTQMFKAAAPENVHQLLSHRDQTKLTVEEAYKIYFTGNGQWKWTIGNGQKINLSSCRQQELRQRAS